MNKHAQDYQLRYAAGRYWLLDMRQQGAEYQGPICLNESGAYLWKLFEAGKSREQIAIQLSGEFDLELEEARRDTDEFFNCIGVKKY
jgi:hypothetical protein